MPDPRALIEEARRLAGSALPETPLRAVVFIDSARTLLPELADALEAAMQALRCASCGAPATCLGRYDERDDAAYGCDDCCGHGCEDGNCYLLPDAAAPLARLPEAQP